MGKFLRKSRIDELPHLVNSASIEESEAKLRYDLYDIKNMSFWLDLQILLDTFKVIAFGRGAR